MSLHTTIVIFLTVVAFGFIEGGIIQELDSAFGSFAKLPRLLKRWYHPKKNEATQHGVTQNYEELPRPMHLKDELKGYRRDDATYILEDSSGTPCVLAYFKASITVYYPTNIKEELYDSRMVTPPDDVKVSGTCDRDSMIAVLDLSWPKGTFSLRFAFDDISDSWFVDQFKFDFDTSYYPGAAKDENVVMISEENKRFWTTSHARSFRCLLLHDVSLGNDMDTYSGTIHFNEARVQALTKSPSFKNPKHCIHRVHRDVLVPITVGGAMCGLIIVTIAGYAAFRYFKVKKFQYGNME